MARSSLVRRRAVAAGAAVVAAARAGDARGPRSTALGCFRLLCAHRRGPYGVSDWSTRLLGWLAAEIEDLDLEQRDYVGRPLLVTENDYELGLYNGDTGVIVAPGEAPRPLLSSAAASCCTSARCGSAPVETVYAMTVHKSQGSQFDTAAVLLPVGELAHPHARAALHRGHARASGADPGRHRGRPCGTRSSGRWRGPRGSARGSGKVSVARTQEGDLSISADGYEELRAAIVDGELLPGARLLEVAEALRSDGRARPSDRPAASAMRD